MTGSIHSFMTPTSAEAAVVDPFTYTHDDNQAAGQKNLSFVYTVNKTAGRYNRQQPGTVEGSISDDDADVDQDVPLRPPISDGIDVKQFRSLSQFLQPRRLTMDVHNVDSSMPTANVIVDDDSQFAAKPATVPSMADDDGDELKTSGEQLPACRFMDGGVRRRQNGGDGATGDDADGLSASVVEITDDTMREVYADQAHSYVESLPTAVPPATVCTPLMKHQCQALWWMMNRAYGHDTEHPCALQQQALLAKTPVIPSTVPGVILADDMGLGKTLMTLAFLADRVVRRNKTLNDVKRRTPVLLVCPTSVICNWIDQARTHVPSLRVLDYNANKDGKDRKSLLAYDIVVVTYDNVRISFKRSFVASKTTPGSTATGATRMSSSYSPLPAVERDLLYQIMWNCIVLDEAHRIKNVHTKVAIACRHLVGSDDAFRVCLTGTPVHNCSDNLTSLLHFIRVDMSAAVYTAVPASFAGTVAGVARKKTKGAAAPVVNSANDDNNNNNAPSPHKPPIYELLDRVMLRRRKDTQLDGSPIVALPEVSHEVVGLDATPLQHLLQHAVVDYVRRQIRNAASASAVTTTRPDGSTTKMSSGKKPDRRMYYTCLLGALRRMQQVADHGILPFHTLSPDRGTLDELCHVTRKALLSLPAPTTVELPGTFLLNHHRSHHENSHIIGARHCIGTTTTSISETKQTRVLSASGDHRLTVTVLTPECNADMAVFGVTVAQLLERDPLPQKSSRVDLRECDAGKYSALSNKATYLVTEAQRILSEDPSAKIVIFSQFVQFLHLLNTALRHALPSDVTIVQLDGSVAQKHRPTMIHQFQTDPSTRIFLGSLKAGGEGLNLTAANWIYIADPVRSYISYTAAHPFLTVC